MIKQLENKRGLFIFGDPAGAKACLSICYTLNNDLNLALSNRVYPFYENFITTVENSTTKTIVEWFDYHNPDYLFTGTSLPDKNELLFIKEAQKRKIVSFSFIDHWINIKERFKLNEDYVYPSKICLINKQAREIAISEGIPAEIIQVNDNPYYDYLKKWHPPFSKIEMLEQLKLNSETEYILYAPEPFTKFDLQNKYGFDEVSGLKHIINALNELQDWDLHIVVKAHPNQNHQIFDEILHNKNVTYVTDFDINLLLYYSKCVFGFFSNSLIEASKMNCTIYRLLIDLKNPALDPLNELSIGKKIKNKRELLTELKNKR
jgi:hypothetical protein